ncbi:hypothetical protein ACQW5G_04025 [Fructilactobacillus sp. Tb1]|uniref:hypothetical protein n=1 Tax=Fructilactobacillus sp. Tb1 TaxID=3422304 RepID=UPI003D27DEC3
MKILLLDIDDTLCPLSYKGPDAVTVDEMGVQMAAPKYVVDGLKDFASKPNNSIVWATHRKRYFANTLAREMGFKTDGYLTFRDSSDASWNKLPDLVEYANEHPDDLVINADNDAFAVKPSEVPANLKFIVPDGKKGCLSENDFKKINDMKEENN